jgi:hypothetical protein
MNDIAPGFDLDALTEGWGAVKLVPSQAGLPVAVLRKEAERIARDEAAGLRAELDARRVWGLRRRLRWALSGRR